MHLESGEWKWRVGVLHGFGECIWQQMGNRLRRITKLILAPNGALLLAKTVLDQLGAFKDVDAGVLIVTDCVPQQSLIDDANRAWDGKIIVGNGRIARP